MDRLIKFGAMQTLLAAEKFDEVEEFAIAGMNAKATIETATCLSVVETILPTDAWWLRMS